MPLPTARTLIAIASNITRSRTSFSPPPRRPSRRACWRSCGSPRPGAGVRPRKDDRARRITALRGRPAGTARGELRPGNRLDLIATLRAAAPWQALRRRDGSARTSAGASDRRRRIEIRREDFRVTRFTRRTPTTVIFAVDASGSSALHRLAETKGAVELLLAECYVRRDRVAQVIWRDFRQKPAAPPWWQLMFKDRSAHGSGAVRDRRPRRSCRGVPPHLPDTRPRKQLRISLLRSQKPAGKFLVPPACCESVGNLEPTAVISGIVIEAHAGALKLVPCGVLAWGAHFSCSR